MRGDDEGVLEVTLSQALALLKFHRLVLTFLFRTSAWLTTQTETLDVKVQRLHYTAKRMWHPRALSAIFATNSSLKYIQVSSWFERAMEMNRNQSLDQNQSALCFNTDVPLPPARRLFAPTSYSCEGRPKKDTEWKKIRKPKCAGNTNKPDDPLKREKALRWGNCSSMRGRRPKPEWNKLNK